MASVLLSSQVLNNLHLSLPLPPSLSQILGLGVTATGSYLLYLGEENDYDVITGNEIISGAALLVAAGGLTLIISIFGILGAIFMWRPLLILVSDTYIHV